jgi:hypothetical protein
MSHRHLGNKNAKDRVKEFPQDLYVDQGILFCRACEKVLDHHRKSTVTDHLSSYNWLKSELICIPWNSRFLHGALCGKRGFGAAENEIYRRI